MNWLDIALLVLIGISAVAGMRVGLISASMAVVGVFIGLSVAGQVTEEARAWFDDSVSDNTIFTVVSYSALVVVALLVSRVAARFTKSILKMLTMGLSSMVDKLGGVALGAAFGVAVAGAIILVGAKIAYDFDAHELENRLPQQTMERLPSVEESLGVLERVLEESKAVAMLVNVSDTFPENTLRLVPSDFRTALDILKEKGIGKDGSSILSPP